LGTTGTVVVRASQNGNIAYNAAPDVSCTFIIKEQPFLSSFNITQNQLYVPMTGVVVFAGKPLDQYGDLLNASITWSVSGGGTINEQGILNANNILGIHKVYATTTYQSITKKDSTTFTITPKYRAISINLTNNGYNVHTNEGAGVLKMYQWENITASKSGLKDNAGVVTSASISFSGTAQQTRVYDTISPDKKMMYYYRNINGKTLYINNLPSIFTTNTYDVYLYTYQPTTNGNSMLYTFSIGVDTLCMKTKTTTWDGVFTQSTASIASKATVANYVCFKNRTESSLTIKASNLCAIQIVALDTSTTTSKLNQTITFNPTDRYYQDAVTFYSLPGTSSTGLNIYYTVVSGNALVTGKTLAINDTGSITIKAWHPGNEAYNPAPDVIKTFKAIKKLNQTITWTQITPILVKSFPATINLTATTSSGLPLVYSIMDGVASYSGTILTVNSQDVIELQVSQIGNDQYYPATTAKKTIEFIYDPSTSISVQNTTNSQTIIYPNPIHDFIIIKTNHDKTSQVRIYNIYGQVMYSNSLTGMQNKIDVSKFARGLYFLEILNCEKREVRKLVKE